MEAKNVEKFKTLKAKFRDIEAKLKSTIENFNLGCSVGGKSGCSNYLHCCVEYSKCAQQLCDNIIYQISVNSRNALNYKTISADERIAYAYDKYRFGANNTSGAVSLRYDISRFMSGVDQFYRVKDLFKQCCDIVDSRSLNFSDNYSEMKKIIQAFSYDLGNVSLEIENIRNNLISDKELGYIDFLESEKSKIDNLDLNSISDDEGKYYATVIYEWAEAFFTDVKSSTPLQFARAIAIS